MNTTLKYFFKTGEYLDRDGEYDGDDGHEFHYEVDYEDFREALKELVVEEYGEGAWKMVEDFCLEDEVATMYEEQLKDYFEEEAMEYYYG